uniref:Uncharacterized protein n=1 Tax=Anguilla anguilla TaxID=7936 RepID=A0A0E9SQ29_ANGAN
MVKYTLWEKILICTHPLNRSIIRPLPDRLLCRSFNCISLQE